jgi:hypothetical protein
LRARVCWIEIIVRASADPVGDFPVADGCAVEGFAQRIGIPPDAEVLVHVAGLGLNKLAGDDIVNILIVDDEPKNLTVLGFSRTATESLEC